jgi:hypothetical protein
MSAAMLQSADVAAKTTSATWSRSFRPWRSPSLPQSGVAAAHHPRDVAQATEVAGDHRQRGGQDGLVEDGGEHGQDDRGERDADPGVRSVCHDSKYSYTIFRCKP